jgi:hypothetical protein
MPKLAAVEEARTLMTEAIDWSVWKWLKDKKRVRLAADRATDAQERCENKIKSGWSDDLKLAYNELLAKADANGKAKSPQYEKAKEAARHVDARLKQVAKRVFDADEKAYQIRMDAEDTFAEAERRLSTDMAKVGARKAIESYDLHDKAIRLAETADREC